MTWRQPVRSPEAAALYRAADEDLATRPERYRLDAEIVVERATERGVDAESFADGWSDGLRMYLGSADEEGRLNSLGRRMVQDSAVGRLRAGHRIKEAHAAGSGRRLTVPPIVIVGGWRTGTTFLFRLLGGDPRLHAPLPAELTAPWRFAGVERSDRRELIGAAAGAHEFLKVLNPAMAAVHDSGPWLAEECVLAMGTDLRNWGFPSTVRLDSYAEWLAGQDLSGSYFRYRQALELLADGDDRRLVLKAPAHTGELDHLVAEFPGAVVVHLHRDIVDTVASGSSLFAVFRSTYSDHVDPIEVGRYMTDQTELWLDRARAARSDESTRGATFVDIAYGDLVDDTESAVAKIYAAADLDAPDLSESIARHHADHPRTAHGPHRYAAADFGLDPEHLRERFEDLETP